MRLMTSMVFGLLIACGDKEAEDTAVEAVEEVEEEIEAEDTAEEETEDSGEEEETAE